jgi:hypothetical protein
MRVEGVDLCCVLGSPCANVPGQRATGPGNPPASMPSAAQPFLSGLERLRTAFLWLGTA